MSTTGRDCSTVDAIGAPRRARLAGDTPAAELVTSAARANYPGWLSHVAPAAGCAHPVKLSGTVYRVDQSTGRITWERHTSRCRTG